MLVVIPAHFLGSVVGIVLFKTIFPFVPSVVSIPVSQKIFLILDPTEYGFLLIFYVTYWSYLLGVSSSLQSSHWTELRHTDRSSGDFFGDCDDPSGTRNAGGEQAEPQDALGPDVSDYVSPLQRPMVQF
jgi:hypothetical protein